MVLSVSAIVLSEKVNLMQNYARAINLQRRFKFVGASGASLVHEIPIPLVEFHSITIFEISASQQPDCCLQVRAVVVHEEARREKAIEMCVPICYAIS